MDAAPRSDIEPSIGTMLDERLLRRNSGPYSAVTTNDVAARLARLLNAAGLTEFRIEALARMPGGASKEQFWFELVTPAWRERMVLRMDPLEGIVETCRHREVEILSALHGHVPVAEIRFADCAGKHLGQPGIVTSFVSGVTKPPVAGGQVLTGIGTAFDATWRARLTPHFVSNLAAIHKLPWRAASLPHYQAPLDHPQQAALWQLNWWARVWREDAPHPYPLLTLAEHWMRANLPACTTPVLVHGDYRTSNFMFDAQTGAYTAVLDWELAHIGDFHEDLAYSMQALFAGAPVEGESLVSGLLPRAEFLARYTQATGHAVDERSLGFYEIFAAYKLAAMNLGTSPGIAKRRNNHQDVVLTYLSPVGHVFLSQLADALAREMQL